jgi:teichuronic acid biosynthesis glycosyltransferase TuaC
VNSAESPVAPGRPLHVLTITPFYPKIANESSGCFVAEPLHELAKVGLKSTVFAVEPFYRPRPRKLTSAPDAEWYRYAALPGGVGLASSGAGLFARLRAPASELHAQSPIDVIHAHGALPCGHAAMLLDRHLKIPFVVTVHGLDAFSSRQVSGWFGVSCGEVSRRVYAAACRVIGVSQHVCDEIQRGMGAFSSAVVVHNGVDPAMFTPGDDPEQPVLLTVGDLIPTKGHELMLRAVAALRSEFPKLVWEVIGDGPELNRIRSLAENLDLTSSIRFHGRQSRTAVAEAFRRCTVFALPSHYEGLGCVYLEAMVSGKVAIGCSGQGIEEIIRHGENGCLVPPNGLVQLSDGLRVLLQNASRRREIGAAARETILQSFTVAHQAERVLSIYRECLS